MRSFGPHASVRAKRGGGREGRGMSHRGHACRFCLAGVRAAATCTTTVIHAAKPRVLFPQIRLRRNLIATAKRTGAAAMLTTNRMRRLNRCQGHLAQPPKETRRNQTNCPRLAVEAQARDKTNRQPSSTLERVTRFETRTVGNICIVTSAQLLGGDEYGRRRDYGRDGDQVVQTCKGGEVEGGDREMGRLDESNVAWSLSRTAWIVLSEVERTLMKTWGSSVAVRGSALLGAQLAHADDGDNLFIIGKVALPPVLNSTTTFSQSTTTPASSPQSSTASTFSSRLRPAVGFAAAPSADTEKRCRSASPEPTGSRIHLPMAHMIDSLISMSVRFLLRGRGRGGCALGA
ncbi:hypothetical protein PENSPDRAFT_739826 [Peniophora sp. CONT]|nr:hypothetical protein PENSPDRAFT_739826 [Peniophora sp. CONT]